MTVQFTKKQVCTGHRAALYAVAQGRTDRHFLTAGGDGWVTEWDLDDLETGRVIAQVDDRVFALTAMDPSGKYIVGNMTGGVHWLDQQHPETARHIQQHKKGVFDIQIIDNQVFTIGGDGVLTRWDMTTRRIVESVHLTNKPLRCAAYSPQKNMLAIGSSDGGIYIVGLPDLSVQQHIVAAHLPSVFTVAWHPEQHYLLSGGRDAMLRVWDSENGFELISAQPAHWYTINHIVFAPDGRLFATASRDKTIKIWDATTFKLLKVLDVLHAGGHINSVNRLLWLPDYLISVSDDRTAIVWAQ
jgi:WD40 repeat protein